MYRIRAAFFLASFSALLLIGGPKTVAAPRVEGGAAGMRKYNSPFYDVYTDVEPDLARETLVRMTAMAEEYHNRTKGLFSGTINQKLPFYLFSRKEDYIAAGAPLGTAGVFMSKGMEGKLMAVLTLGRGGVVDAYTWHTIQHEGFHQFAHYVVRGDIPVWVNEGMAEYFGEGIFTGDGMITAIVPPARCKRVKAGITENRFKSLDQMMHMNASEWRSATTFINYDQAWSMCQFLSHGENGKYQNAFASFMQGIGRGQPPERAWEANFGGAAGFEGKWKEYWLNLPENATQDLYAKSVVATLTSYLGRATSQKQKFAGFDEFVGTDVSALKMNEFDWLPHRLYNDAARRAKSLAAEGYVFALAPGAKKQFTVVCTTPSGQELLGAFRLNGSRMADPSPVTVEMIKPQSMASKEQKPIKANSIAGNPAAGTVPIVTTPAEVAGSAIAVKTSNQVKVAELKVGAPRLYDSNPLRRIEGLADELHGFQFTSIPQRIDIPYEISVRKAGTLYVFGFKVASGVTREQVFGAEASKWEIANEAISGKNIEAVFRRKVVPGDVVRINWFEAQIAAESIEIVAGAVSANSPAGK